MAIAMKSEEAVEMLNWIWHSCDSVYNDFCCQQSSFNTRSADLQSKPAGYIPESASPCMTGDSF